MDQGRMTFELQQRATALSLDPPRRPKAAAWRDIPEDAIAFSARNSIAAPAAAALTNVTSYTCQRGFRGCLAAIFCLFDGAGFTSGMANGIAWQITINTPLTGAVPGTGRFLPDYEAITTNLGSFDSGPWPIAAGVNNRFEDGDILRFNVNITAAALGGQLGAVVTCMLIGWIWPVERMNRDNE